MHRMSCLIEHNVYRLRVYVPFHSEIKSENTNMWKAGNANPRWSSPEQAMISQDWTHNVGYFLSHWCKHFNHIKAWSFLCYARNIQNTYFGISGVSLFSVWQHQWQNRLQLSAVFSTVKPTSCYTLPKKYVVKHDNIMYWQYNLQISATFSSICAVFGFNPLNAELNPICHLLALLGGATILVVSRLRVKQRIPEQWLLFISIPSSKEKKQRIVLNMHATMHFAINKITYSWEMV